MVKAKIGRGNKVQETINILKFSYDIEEFNNIFLNNKDEITNKFLQNSKKSEKEFWSIFWKTKKFNINLNNHVIKFVLHNKNNLEKIFKYINFRYLFNQVSIKKIVSDYPPYLLIEPVSTCNLRCPFCFQTDKSFTKKPFMGVMNLDLFKNIIDQANDLGVGAVTLASRGEPTLHKNLKDMLKYMHNKKNIFEKKINTNATFLNEELCYEIFNNEINNVVISADHYEKEIYEKLRKGSNFEKIVKNVDMLFEIRKKFPNSLTEIRISGLNFYKSIDKKQFYNFWIQRSDHVTIGEVQQRWDTYNNKKHPEINDPCEKLWDRMYVWFDGKVNPCDVDYKSYLSYGSVKEYSIKELWNNKIINKIRNEHVSNDRNKINPCNKCGITFE